MSDTPTIADLLTGLLGPHIVLVAVDGETIATPPDVIDMQGQPLTVEAIEEMAHALLTQGPREDAMTDLPTLGEAAARALLALAQPTTKETR